MKFEGKSVQGQIMEDYITEEADLTVIIMDVLSRNYIIKSNKRFLNERE
jgi:C4-type Zn-finger protein